MLPALIKKMVKNQTKSDLVYNILSRSTANSLADLYRMSSGEDNGKEEVKIASVSDLINKILSHERYPEEWLEKKVQ